MIFSPKWIREKAKEILGHDDISLTLESPGKVKIVAKNITDNLKFNQFKKTIEQNKPFNAKVTICKLN